ncbi:MAG: hypothetical protein MJ153_07480, partial [Clostridia bacterium]|nr:hypothetical protein [Clostridia bacterium]
PNRGIFFSIGEILGPFWRTFTVTSPNQAIFFSIGEVLGPFWRSSTVKSSRITDPTLLTA